jgi:hypothetical protein
VQKTLCKVIDQLTPFWFHKSGCTDAFANITIRYLKINLPKSVSKSIYIGFLGLYKYQYKEISGKALF